MALSLDGILRLQDGLFRSALGEITFADALTNIISAFGGEGGVVFEMNRRTGEIVDWVGPGLEDGRDEYAKRLNAINPRMRYSLRHAPGHVVYEGRFIDDRSIDRHEFYDGIRRLSGVRYFMGVRVHDEGDTSLFHSVEFTPQHGHPDPGEIEMFRRLAPEVGHAWRLAKRRSVPTRAVSPWAPDHLPWAIFVLAADGRVLELNTQAESLIVARDGLDLADGQLEATIRTSSAGLRRALQSALGGIVSETLVARSDAVSLVLQAVPVPGTRGIDPGAPAVVVYVWDIKRAECGRTAAVQRLFRLSDAEVRVVAMIAKGLSLRDAADGLMLTRNTVRNHLQSVFAKTGTRRQSELLAQILGMIDG